MLTLKLKSQIIILQNGNRILKGLPSQWKDRLEKLADLQGNITRKLVWVSAQIERKGLPCESIITDVCSHSFKVCIYPKHMIWDSSKMQNELKAIPSEKHFQVCGRRSTPSIQAFQDTCRLRWLTYDDKCEFTIKKSQNTEETKLPELGSAKKQKNIKIKNQNTLEYPSESSNGNIK